MIDKYLKQLCDNVTDAHSRIKQDFKEIDPVVGVSQKMRDSGIAADVMTIDCLRSGKRIIIILHDQQPNIVSYQFTFKAQDPAEQFEQTPLAELSADKLYDWMESYFS
ncbi:hypothetical protein [Neptunomonas japonica]|uniref:Uncharacterized protein n=1 Tax=Neptunomonas japonica JAMM 1380 TaxID=1441457 RepID=A0A7R6PBS1_9GAMM|nr:hypothetical protein [Neptunomonas japonica]BBB30843.1 conserved hypothetical protein [Neptunomonas japonica JAMM 1380]